MIGILSVCLNLLYIKLGLGLKLIRNKYVYIVQDYLTLNGEREKQDGSGPSLCCPCRSAENGSDQ